MIRRSALACTTGLLLVLVMPAPSGAAISYIGRDSVATTTATLTLTTPNKTTDEDLLVATVSGAGTDVIDAPPGWILLATTASTDATMRTVSYYKVVTPSESNTVAFTSSAAREMTGGLIVLRGVNPHVSVDALATASGGSGSAVAPSVTTGSANGWVITAVSVARNSAFTAAPGTTERYERAGISTSNQAATASQAAAGASPARTVVPANSSANWIAHTIALRDAAAAGLTVELGAASGTFTSSLDDGDTTEQWTIAATVGDTRIGSGAGWQLQVTSTTLTTGTRSLPANATDVTAVSGLACAGGAPCVLPTNNVALPVGVPAGATAPTAVKFYNAAGATGEGRIDMSVTFAPLVPQNAYAGSYSSTVTISVISGP